MAIRLEEECPGQVDESDPTGWPTGAPRDELTPDDGTGTPLISAWLKDMWAFFESLMDDAGITHNDTPDKVGASQRYDAFGAVVGGAIDAAIALTQDVQAFTATGAGTWTKPAWATATTPVKVICVPGGASGAGGTSVAGGGGGGGIPVVGEYLAGTLAATEPINVGAGGAAPTAGQNGIGGSSSDFATGKQYITATSVTFGGNIVSNANGGAGGNGGGGGGNTDPGSGGTGGGGGGAGTNGGATGGTGAFTGFGGFIGACSSPGAGGSSNNGGAGGRGWGAGGGGGAAGNIDRRGGGGGGSGWTGYPGYPTAESGENRDGSNTVGGAGTQGIVVVITG